MNLGLNQKIALITGASRGLGFAIAQLLAEEGARVTINSRDSQKLREAAGIIQQKTNQEIHVIAGDVTQPETPERLVEECAAKFGGLDILIANAGGPHRRGFVLKNSWMKTWYQAIELSFMSQVRLIRAALPYLKNHRPVVY